MYFVAANQVNITIESEQLNKENVMVVLKLTEEIVSDSSLSFSYHISIIPPLPIRFLGRTRAQITIPYNSHHNVTFVDTTPCKEDNVTSSVVLYYGKFLTPWKLKIEKCFQNVS